MPRIPSSIAPPICTRSPTTTARHTCSRPATAKTTAEAFASAPSRPGRLAIQCALALLCACDLFAPPPRPEPAQPPPIATPPAETERSTPGVRATLVSVTDGDTIKVRTGGKVERVRLIGIDTPETKNSPRGPQPFAEEATAAVTRLLGGGELILRLDAEERDRYGRLLAYVYADDGTFVNEAMIREGWARPLRVPPNVAHAKQFDALSSAARNARRGIWSGR